MIVHVWMHFEGPGVFIFLSALQVVVQCNLQLHLHGETHPLVKDK